MASKVLVKIPVTPFGHVNKSKTNDVAPEIVTVGRPTDGVGTSKNTDPLLRIAQLEQNIRFLQEQHQLMLTGLHQEIDSLRQRNRDLQFQLVFSKGAIVSSSSASPSSPEEEGKARVLSPKQVNVTPLQVELLERELSELKVNLQEVNTRNAYLTAIVDEQKKKLERTEQSIQQDPELLNKLDDVENIVRRLRRENDDLRRELNDIRSSNASGKGGGGHGRGGRHRGSNNHYRGHRFPPLHTQSYWQQGNRAGDRDGDTGAPPGAALLPALGNMNQPQQGAPQQQQGQQGQRRNHGPPTGANNNQYHHHHKQHGDGEGGAGSGGRRYRGGGGHHSRAPH